MTVDRGSHRGGPHLSRFGLTSHGGHKIFPHIVPTVKRKKDEEEKEKERRVKKGRMINDRGKGRRSLLFSRPEQLLASFFALEWCGCLSKAVPLDRSMMALAWSQCMG